MPPRTAILVSALVPLERSGRPDSAEYLRRAGPLLSLDLPKIIFMPARYIEQCRDAAHAATTTFVPFEPEDMERDVPLDTSWALPPRRNTHKDTHQYMQVQLHKTAWLRRAAEMVQESDNTHFMWLDLGLIHVFPGRDAAVFQAAVRAAAAGAAGLDRAKVRIAGIWPRGAFFSYGDKLWEAAQRGVLWYLAGGVFGGCGPALRAFDSEVQEELARLRKHKRWTWEVNVWALVLARNPELFDVYTADHNPTILTHYAPALVPNPKVTAEPISVSVVIPCVPAHVSVLVQCVESARRQTRPPEEIVVALSSCTQAMADSTQAKLAVSSAGEAPVRLTWIPGPANAASNRNRGMDVARHTIVSFMDADDTMLPQRLEQVVQLMERHNADAVLHGYQEVHPGREILPVPQSNRVRSPEEMALLEADDRSCIHLTCVRVAHGHVTVRRRVADKIQMDPCAVKCEDSVFVRQVFAHRFRVACTEAVLSYYKRYHP